MFTASNNYTDGTRNARALGQRYARLDQWLAHGERGHLDPQWHYSNRGHSDGRGCTILNDATSTAATLIIGSGDVGGCNFQGIIKNNIGTDDRRESGGANPSKLISARAADQLVRLHRSCPVDGPSMKSSSIDWCKSNRWERCTDLTRSSGSERYNGLDFLSMEMLMRLAGVGDRILSWATSVACAQKLTFASGFEFKKRKGNSMRLTHSIGFVLILVLFPTLAALAEKSNRDEVRKNLSQDGWTLIWGKNFTEADWARGTASIAESIATYNPGPFLAWFQAAWEENYQKIANNLEDVSRKQIGNWIVDSLKQKKAITYKGFKLEAGFATYNRWDSAVYDEPRTRKNRRTGLPEFYTERVEKKIPLPNWHQVYIRYQLKESVSHGGGSHSKHENKLNLYLEKQSGPYGNSSQRWILVKTDTPDVYLIKNFRKKRDDRKDIVLDYENSNNAYLEAQIDKYGNSSQRWILEKTDEQDVFLIKSFRKKRDEKKDMVLDYRRAGDKLAPYLEEQAGKYGNSSQRWILVKTDTPDVYVIKSFRKKRDEKVDMVLDFYVN